MVKESCMFLYVVEHEFVIYFCTVGARFIYFLVKITWSCRLAIKERKLRVEALNSYMHVLRYKCIYIQSNLAATFRTFSNKVTCYQMAQTDCMVLS